MTRLSFTNQTEVPVSISTEHIGKAHGWLPGVWSSPGFVCRGGPVREVHIIILFARTVMLTVNLPTYRPA
jgi:hypothetical protein